MTFKLEIIMGNDAMLVPQDIQEALSKLARQIYFLDLKEMTDGAIIDRNGNTVGKWIFDEK